MYRLPCNHSRFFPIHAVSLGRQKVLAVGGESTVVALMHSHAGDVAVVTAACNVLRCLAYEGVGRAAVLQCGAPELVLHALESHLGSSDPASLLHRVRARLPRRPFPAARPLALRCRRWTAPASPLRCAALRCDVPPCPCAALLPNPPTPRLVCSPRSPRRAQHCGPLAAAAALWT